MTKLYQNGSAHYPARFWAITTNPVIEGSQYERPELNLNKEERERYEALVKEDSMFWGRIRSI